MYACVSVSRPIYTETYAHAHNQLKLEQALNHFTALYSSVGELLETINGLLNTSPGFAFWTLFLQHCFIEMERREIQEERLTTRNHGLASFWGDYRIS